MRSVKLGRASSLGLEGSAVLFRAPHHKSRACGARWLWQEVCKACDADVLMSEAGAEVARASARELHMRAARCPFSQELDILGL